MRLDASPDWLEPSAQGSQPHTVSLGGDPLPLLLDGPARIGLTVHHHYRIIQNGIGDWRVTTAAYYYAIDAQDGGEILSYHWHPENSSINYPHLHVGPSAVNPNVVKAANWAPGANALRPDLSKAHLPTGRTALEDVVMLLIEQFQVPERGHWAATLQRSRAEFERTRQWHDRPS